MIPLKLIEYIQVPQSGVDNTIRDNAEGWESLRDALPPEVETRES